MTPANHIRKFLRDNSQGPLWVTVGFASAYGLGWLNQQTTGRKVNLLIGDTRTGFSKFSEYDRQQAIDFLQRSDVSVKNWYRRRGGHRTAHAKAWMVCPDPQVGVESAALVGSANLTKKGLFENTEMLALAAKSEHPRLLEEMHELMELGWSCEDRLRRMLKAEQYSQVTRVRRIPQNPQTLQAAKTRPKWPTQPASPNTGLAASQNQALAGFLLALCGLITLRVPVLNVIVCTLGMALSRISLLRTRPHSGYRGLALGGLTISTLVALLLPNLALVVVAAILWTHLYLKGKRQGRH